MVKTPPRPHCKTKQVPICAHLKSPAGIFCKLMIEGQSWKLFGAHRSLNHVNLEKEEFGAKIIAFINLFDVL